MTLVGKREREEERGECNRRSGTKKETEGDRH